MTDQLWLLVGIISGVISVGGAVYLYYWVMRQDAGSEKAQEVAGWIREGAASYLKKLYTALTLVAVVMGFIIAVVFSFDLTQLGTGSVDITPSNGVIMAIAFVVAADSSAIAG